MKWLLILALVSLVSCATKQDEAKEVAASAATESEAQPVSPHTIKPCYCQKIFMPVCAGGQDYGNSCEAECNGHKTWKDGNCRLAPTTKKITPKKKG